MSSGVLSSKTSMALGGNENEELGAEMYDVGGRHAFLWRASQVAPGKDQAESWLVSC